MHPVDSSSELPKAAATIAKCNDHRYPPKQGTDSISILWHTACSLKKIDYSYHPEKHEKNADYTLPASDSVYRSDRQRRHQPMEW